MFTCITCKLWPLYIEHLKLMLYVVYDKCFHCLNVRVKFSCWQGVKMGSMRFRFDGQPINESDTPAQVIFFTPRSLNFKIFRFAGC